MRVSGLILSIQLSIFKSCNLLHLQYEGFRVPASYTEVSATQTFIRSYFGLRIVHLKIVRTKTQTNSVFDKQNRLYNKEAMTVAPIRTFSNFRTEWIVLNNPWERVCLLPRTVIVHQWYPRAESLQLSHLSCFI